ncbi:type 2 lanthipeptide synthetase LanM family protein [Halorussus litoreus]|uniref:type 2 lanthipeptide synthetase LanM family protein n=1 Tax=Halorussus litoreus TaxID=1710536 RepID=UPI000E260FA7|nr:type 2 lanthipeptide synthetase LanM family protein [Halorussus litoreus]
MTTVFSEDHKRLIAGRARTLFERFEDPEAVEHGFRDEEEVTEIFEEWEETFSTEESFERRLDQLDATEAECRQAISADRLAESEPIPEWVDRLDDLVASVHRTTPEKAAERLGPEGYRVEEERTFKQLSAAIAAHACDQLDESVLDVLSAEAVWTMADWFRRRLEDRFVRILFVEFKAFIAAHDEDMAFAEPEDFDDGDLPTDYYELFLGYLFDGGFGDLCQEYPMFARLVVTQIRQWHEHLEEFGRRLEADRDALADRFGYETGVGNVTHLEPLADDTHGDGRAVMHVEFESGLDVAYKPRSVEAGQTFYRMLERFNDHLAVPDFKTPTYLPRGDYGWMEWIEYEECEDSDAVERYYQRAGALASLAYFLEFTDCQYENVIINGEYPMLVDAETIFTPHVSVERKPTRTGIGSLRDKSLLLTLLIPYDVEDMHTDQSGGQSSTISGFSDSADEDVLEDITNPAIQAVNTDVMKVDHQPVPVDPSENIPMVDGEAQPPADYLEEFLDGFETAYETVMELRDTGQLTDDVELFDSFRSVENRIVYRPTMQYGSVIKSLSSRHCLGDGARFGVEIDELSVPFCNGIITEPKPWALYDAERVALKRLDPPRFTCRPDDTELELNGETLGVEADESGMERARQRIESASEDDLQMQIEFVRGCFGVTPDAKQDGNRPPDVEPEPATDEAFHEEAVALFEDLRESALEGVNGGYYWASVAPWTETERLTLRPAGGSMYSGRSGIALLGAGLYHLTGEDRYRSFALDAVQGIRQAVRLELPMPSLTNHGGATGIGSVAYGLSLVGDLADEPEIYDDVRQLPNFFTDEALEADDTYDATAGSAGTVLGLLGAHDRVGGDELLSAARDCGDYLLDNRVETDDGVRVWQTLEDCPPMAGFAHGVSGIAYVLLRLWNVTGETKYRDAALEALEFEDAQYSESAQNWPDPRGWSETEFLDQWCYGRSGIGLARLGMTEYTTDDRVTRGLERAVDGFPNDGIDRFDHVCCGEAGRSAFLLEAEQRRGDRSGEARERLGAVLDRKREAGIYQTLAHTDKIDDPTFFHGTAGIGYSMLRVTAPDELPSVLLWE